MELQGISEIYSIGLLIVVTSSHFCITTGNGGLNRSPSSQSLGSDSGAEDDVDGENLKPYVFYAGLGK